MSDDDRAVRLVIAECRDAYESFLGKVEEEAGGETPRWNGTWSIFGGSVAYNQYPDAMIRIWEETRKAGGIE
jgi:hypothetical protein